MTRVYKGLKTTTRRLALLSIVVTTLLLSTLYISVVELECTTLGRRGTLLKLCNTLQQSIVTYFRPRSCLILLWTGYYSENWLYHLERQYCSSNCRITNDRTQLCDSDAVVFHLRNVKVDDVPSQKPKHQRWVLFNQEAPPNTPKELVQALEGKIDWTITYRRDSDIFAPYGKVVKRKSPLPRNETKGALKNETQLVCWIVSHCATQSRREAYVKILRSYVPVAVYGKCGQLNCTMSNSRSCYQHVAKSCKFYLSLENSLCADYVTEKLFYAMNAGMVPIIMAGEGSTELLPPNSYISYRDFQEPKDLASFLLELDRDDDRYNSYTRWKEDYEVKDESYTWICDLCKKLHISPVDVTTRTNLFGWWFDDAMCHNWIDALDKRS